MEKNISSCPVSPVSLFMKVQNWPVSLAQVIRTKVALTLKTKNQFLKNMVRIFMNLALINLCSARDYATE